MEGIGQLKARTGRGKVVLKGAGGTCFTESGHVHYKAALACIDSINHSKQVCPQKLMLAADASNWNAYNANTLDQ